MQECLRCESKFNPKENVFGSCQWHSKHYLATAKPAQPTLEDQLYAYLPLFEKKFGKIDIPKILATIPLKDLLLQIDINCTRLIKEKLAVLPSFIEKSLTGQTINELKRNGLFKQRVDRFYPEHKFINAIIGSLLTELSLAEIREEQERIEFFNSGIGTQPVHQHLHRGVINDGNLKKRVWRCCGLGENHPGCWKGQHSATTTHPDPYTIQDFEKRGFYAFLSPNDPTQASEHVKNRWTNVKLKELRSKLQANQVDFTSPESIAFVFAFIHMNLYNGFELQFDGKLVSSNRAESLSARRIEELVQLNGDGSRVELMWSSAFDRIELSTIVQKGSYNLYRLRNTSYLLKKRRKLENVIPKVMRSSLGDNRIPIDTLLLPVSGGLFIPKNPYKVTPTLKEAFLVLAKKGITPKRVAKITKLVEADWVAIDKEKQKEFDLQKSFAEMMEEFRAKRKKKKTKRRKQASSTSGSESEVESESSYSTAENTESSEYETPSESSSEELETETLELEELKTGAKLKKILESFLTTLDPNATQQTSTQVLREMIEYIRKNDESLIGANYDMIQLQKLIDEVQIPAEFLKSGPYSLSEKQEIATALLAIFNQFGNGGPLKYSGLPFAGQLTEAEANAAKQQSQATKILKTQDVAPGQELVTLEIQLTPENRERLEKGYVKQIGVSEKPLQNPPEIVLLTTDTVLSSNPSTNGLPTQNQLKNIKKPPEKGEVKQEEQEELKVTGGPPIVMGGPPPPPPPGSGPLIPKAPNMVQLASDVKKKLLEKKKKFSGKVVKKETETPKDEKSAGVKNDQAIKIRGDLKRINSPETLAEIEQLQQYAREYNKLDLSNLVPETFFDELRKVTSAVVKIDGTATAQIVAAQFPVDETDERIWPMEYSDLLKEIDEIFIKGVSQLVERADKWIAKLNTIQTVAEYRNVVLSDQNPGSMILLFQAISDKVKEQGNTQINLSTYKPSRKISTIEEYVLFIAEPKSDEKEITALNFLYSEEKNKELRKWFFGKRREKTYNLLDILKRQLKISDENVSLLMDSGKGSLVLARKKCIDSLFEKLIQMFTENESTLTEYLKNLPEDAEEKEKVLSSFNSNTEKALYAYQFITEWLTIGPFFTVRPGDFVDEYKPEIMAAAKKTLTADSLKRAEDLLLNDDLFTLYNTFEPPAGKVGGKIDNVENWWYLTEEQFRTSALYYVDSEFISGRISQEFPPVFLTSTLGIESIDAQPIICTGYKGVTLNTFVFPILGLSQHQTNAFIFDLAKFDVVDENAEIVLLYLRVTVSFVKLINPSHEVDFALILNGKRVSNVKKLYQLTNSTQEIAIHGRSLVIPSGKTEFYEGGDGVVYFEGSHTVLELTKQKPLVVQLQLPIELHPFHLYTKELTASLEFITGVKE